MQSDIEIRLRVQNLVWWYFHGDSIEEVKPNVKHKH